MAPDSPPPKLLGGRRPNPQIAQMRRTLYFLSRNTLAIIGLAVLVFFVGVAVYAFVYPAPSDQLQNYCGTYSPTGVNLCSSGYVQVCTYGSNAPAPNGTCYPVDPLNVSASGSYFYNPFAGLIKGSQWSLGIAAGIVLSGAMIGLFLGSLA